MHDRDKTSENTMSARNPPGSSLPKAWNKQVRSGLVHVIALAQYAILYTRGRAATSPDPDAHEKGVGSGAAGALSTAEM